MTDLILTPTVQKIKADIGDLDVTPIVNKVVSTMYRDFPYLEERFGAKGKERTIEDNFYHFLYLHTAYKLKDTQTFVEYTLWLNSVLVSRGLKTDMIIYNFEKIQESMPGLLDREVEESFLTYLNEGILALKEYKHHNEIK
ncbi:hypothetical protein [Sutcliffiella horikoshii]|uniref:hypothetical protein n=1 Tax=Sutcliffiella horikoshii TaxID=79883 RepID=UPI001F17500D|nr:hypothetical protein [Sutcliffiella horikoshii]MCG1021840.1 hypothetical protein [Sutcliffiella horikoshii]